MSDKKPKKKNRIATWRLAVLAVAAAVIMPVVLTGALYDVQVTNHDKYEQMAVAQQTYTTSVSASRGMILDRNGAILAISGAAYNVYISPYELVKYEEDASFVASNLSRLLDVDYDSIMEKFADTASWYKVISYRLDEDTAETVREFKREYGLMSVHLEETTRRYYPYGSLACQVIGFVGSEGYGLYGIEASFNDYLEGEDGSVVSIRTGRGQKLYQSVSTVEDGCDVTLTIDATVQAIAEKYLQEAVEQYGVKNGGCCIVMDIKTGAILGMANCDKYDLNDYLSVSPSVQAELDLITDEEQYRLALTEARRRQWSSYALETSYEPGSVFKPITLAMALEEAKAKTSDDYDCEGFMYVIGRQDADGTPIPLYCSHRNGHGLLTLAEAVQKSCNVAFVELGIDIGAEKFYDYVEAFGLFEKTGLELTPESSSIWWSESVFYEENNQSQLASASFGQRFTVTPIQMITAFSAAVNGGSLMEPYIVSEVTSQSGDIVYSNTGRIVREVISEDTSALVCELLELVVDGGTGKAAYVEGYRIGGKTGTSEKAGTETEEGSEDYIASFCGVAPADDPEIAVLVIFDTPSDEGGTSISGGAMAAPVAGEIFADVLDYLGVEKDYSRVSAEDIG